MYVHIFSVLYTVPSGPPDDFSVEATSSRTLLLAWQPPVQSKQNGIIIQYMVELSKSGAGVLINFYLNSTQQTLLINETYIEPFTVFGCRIAAFTQVGMGPYSNKISQQTPEDSKLLQVYSYVCTYNVFLLFD